MQIVNNVLKEPNYSTSESADTPENAHGTHQGVVQAKTLLLENI